MPGKRMGHIKNPDQYEALRGQGISKEKAARIANSPPGTREHAGGYEEWTKEELYGKAREVGIEGRSGMSKRELIRALRKGQ